MKCGGIDQLLLVEGLDDQLPIDQVLKGILAAAR